MKTINFIGLAMVVAMLIAPAGFGLAQSSADLGAEGSGLLPSNPFYFLKEWGRGVRKLLTFNPVRKAELELNVLSEKAAELKKLEEITPENVNALSRAAENYKFATEELRARLEVLKETSDNPNVDRLLNQLVDRALKHQKLFDELQVKFENEEELQRELSDLKDDLADVIVAALEKVDSPEKLRPRFEAALAEQKDEFRELRAAELADRLEEKLSSDAAKKEIGTFKDDLLIKFSGRLQGLEFTSPSAAPSIVRRVSGEQVRYLKLLDEVREKVLNPDLKSQLNVVRQQILEEVEEENGIGEEEALQAIENAQKLIAEVEARKTPSVKELLERAKFNLSQAEKLFDEGNYGGAFGQATAAYAAAKSAWAQLTPDIIDNSQTLNSLKSYYDSLAARARSAEITKEQNPKLFELFAEAERRIVELSKLIESKAPQETIAASLRNIKLLLSTAEELITPSLRPVIEIVPIRN
jgi:hypothetical protein